ncbi:DJ-1 family glyoxalase III [Oceanirhabdus sp. W0125-5]|uniref:DJ-1 family glyoxalase III n=1 Tax=Oceanirhabdus sp. W0125-5 TaxID=2999116 RepID=UPI0022F30F37|nr:DJ-1 family glyoxalase III [Oceanirhabdus sp. W0125-5]WBW96183.1 DJ-1/PfpI family protein [Oceanirhabdus sp. W0125-5]
MKKAVVFLAEGFEEIEALTVVDVLRRGGVQCLMCSLDEIMAKGAHNIEIKSDLTLESFNDEEFDAVILPGGMPGSENLMNCENVRNTVIKFKEQNKLVAAICAAPMVLGDCGILEGKKAACYPGFEGYLKGAEVKEDIVVEDGNIVTSRGPATAIYFALKLVEKLQGKEKAEELKKGMMLEFVENTL